MKEGKRGNIVKRPLIIISVIFTIICIIITCIFFKKIESSFFSFSLVDICNLLITVIIGFAFTYFVTIEFQCETRKIDFTLNFFSMLENKMSDLIAFIGNDKKKPITKEFREIVLFKAKIIDADFSLCSNFPAKLNLPEITSIISARRNFSRAITGDWLVVNGKKKRSDINECINAYSQIQRCITEYKTSLLAK